MAEVEMCAGCDAIANEHPVVLVTRETLGGPNVALPVCKLCHENPEHRTHPLKGHFFERGMAAIATDAAERNILVEGNNNVVRKSTVHMRDVSKKTH